MTSVQFNSKSVAERYEIIESQGRFIVNRKNGKIFDRLYLVNDFIAKVFTRLADDKVISVLGIKIEELPSEYSEHIYSSGPIGSTTSKEVFMPHLTISLN